MSDLQLVTHSITVPKGTGVEGFVHTMREILKLSRIQAVSINVKGKVTYERYVSEDEKEPIKVDYDGVEPWHIARNAPDGVEEVIPSSYNAAVALLWLLDRAILEKLYPTGFVTSSNSVLWGWYEQTTRSHLETKKFLCGLPVLEDRHLPDTALILCAALVPDGALVDTQKAYKLEMHYQAGPKTEVEVLDDSSSSEGSS